MNRTKHRTTIALAVAGLSLLAVACGRDYSDVSPIRGVILGTGEHTLEVAVDVVAVEEAAKSVPAKPLSPEREL